MAKDDDLDENGNVLYSIIASYGTDEKSFLTVDKTTGVIITLGNIDLENDTVISVLIEAEDQATSTSIRR